jgi:hypothetical protein
VFSIVLTRSPRSWASTSEQRCVLSLRSPVSKPALRRGSSFTLFDSLDRLRSLRSSQLQPAARHLFGGEREAIARSEHQPTPAGGRPAPNHYPDAQAPQFTVNVYCRPASPPVRVPIRAPKAPQSPCSAASHGSGREGLRPFAPPKVPLIPVFKPDPARSCQVPFGRKHQTFLRLTLSTRGLGGPTAPHHHPAGPRSPQLGTAVRQSPRFAPLSVPPKPRNRCVQATSRAGAQRFAPLCAPQSALNPCVQARSGPGAANSLLGANIRRSAWILDCSPTPKGAGSPRRGLEGAHAVFRPRPLCRGICSDIARTGMSLPRSWLAARAERHGLSEREPRRGAFSRR